MKFSFVLVLALTFCVACDIPVAEETATAETTSTETAAAADTAATTDTTATETATAAPVAEEEKPMDYYKDKVVELKTTKGTITIRFFPEVAPNHVKNFIELSESGFYNGTKFHRTIPGFMIQGGDPNTKTEGPEYWGTGGSGTNVKAEFNAIPHRRGIVSMARSQSPDSASSQFFVVVSDSSFLDNKYTVFGQVTSGMDVADAIVAGKARGDIAVDPVTIQSVTVRPAKDDEKGPLPK
jgi:peptidyl-prolyl cis-trans isomerase B (cyclophilin B)